MPILLPDFMTHVLQYAIKLCDPIIVRIFSSPVSPLQVKSSQVAFNKKQVTNEQVLHAEMEIK